MLATGHARVLFDEAHSEAWTIRPELASRMQPSHPGDASYAHAARALREEGFAVSANAAAPLCEEMLRETSVLVIAHPSDPAWERTTGHGSPRLTAAELDAIEAFVQRGGGLIVLGETEQEKYGNNINELLARFGVHLENDTVQDYEHHAGAPSWIEAALGDGGRGLGADLLARVSSTCLYRATTISMLNGGAGTRVIARAHDSSSAPGAPVIVAGEHGDGRLAVLADSDLFGDDCLGEHDHRALLLNLVYWAAGASVSADASDRACAAVADSAWARLRDATDELALLQAADGSLAELATAPAATALVETMIDAITELAPRFAHQDEYLRLTDADLRAWVAGGFGKPDFGAALAALRPETQRDDGIEHLVVLPMYKQNASRDVCFEALLVRVPWPSWIAQLEATRYGNPQFVPVELLANTRGYDSECAVLFPETVSVADGVRPKPNFGAIFCDRESSRLRRVAAEAVELLALNLPPDAAFMLRSQSISRDAYILWDLIHDRTHSRGDLPFDPFMVRQRAPYWMYSLEELRCDLTAFGEAVELEAEGVAFARNVQYAILLDRLLRFPITGERIRNYDGLGGQLLFAYLHRGGWLEWTDNRLTIDWPNVADGVAAVRSEVADLYKSGIDRSKLRHWEAAHDLVACYVSPASGSRWVSGVRDFVEADDPRQYIDLVLADEFPLSIFYSALKAKLAA